MGGFIFNCSREGGRFHFVYVVSSQAMVVAVHNIFFTNGSVGVRSIVGGYCIDMSSATATATAGATATANHRVRPCY